MTSTDKHINARHVLVECDITEDHCEGVMLFRGPTILDGSGHHKRMPHQINFEHIQVGDSIIAIGIHERPASGLRTMEILQFWDVIDQIEKETFRVRIHNIVGMSADGNIVLDSINALLGKQNQ